MKTETNVEIPQEIKPTFEGWCVRVLTLSEAFRIVDIGDEPVWLQHVNATPSAWNEGYYFWSKTVRDKFDMKKIRVVRIVPVFEHFGPEFEGFCFVISGISQEELQRAAIGPS